MNIQRKDHKREPGRVDVGTPSRHRAVFPCDRDRDSFDFIKTLQSLVEDLSDGRAMEAEDISQFLSPYCGAGALQASKLETEPDDRRAQRVRHALPCGLSK